MAKNKITAKEFAAEVEKYVYNLSPIELKHFGGYNPIGYEIEHKGKKYTVYEYDSENNNHNMLIMQLTRNIVNIVSDGIVYQVTNQELYERKNEFLRLMYDNEPNIYISGISQYTHRRKKVKASL